MRFNEMLVHVTTDLTTTNIMIQTKGTKGGLFFMSVHLENTNFHAHGLDMIFLFFLYQSTWKIQNFTYLDGMQVYFQKTITKEC